MLLSPVFSASSGARLDVVENDNAYRLAVELPGIRKEDIQVKVYENQVTITGESKEEKQVGEAEQNWLLRERSSGKVSRSITLPETVDDSAAEARYEQGVLHLTLPKRQATASRQITVQ
jgi:HSP20 family protein